MTTARRASQAPLGSGHTSSHKDRLRTAFSVICGNTVVQGILNLGLVTRQTARKHSRTNMPLAIMHERGWKAQVAQVGTI